MPREGGEGGGGNEEAAHLFDFFFCPVVDVSSGTHCSFDLHFDNEHLKRMRQKDRA